MGLEGHVRCRCFEQERTREPPVPRDVLRFDAEGYLHVVGVEHGGSEVLLRLMEWQETCCEHPDMTFRAAEVSTWEHYQFFCQVMAQLGWDEFPVLDEALPRAAKGRVDASLVPGSLEELRRVQERIEGAPLPVYQLRLVDTEEVLLESVAQGRAQLFWGASTEVDVVVREGSMRILRSKDQKELFRSAGFRQVPVLGPSGEFLGADFVDAAEEEEPCLAGWRSPIGFGTKGFQRRGPRRVEAFAERIAVTRRTLTVEEFHPIFEPLEALLRASSETGNPVRWVPE